MHGTTPVKPLGTNKHLPWNDREIEESLSEPTPEAIDAVTRLDGDHVVLGASRKMGVTLATMLRRALDSAGKKSARVMGVARFRDHRALEELKAFGVEPVPCDLADYDAVAR